MSWPLLKSASKYAKEIKEIFENKEIKKRSGIQTIRPTFLISRGQHMPVLADGVYKNPPYEGSLVLF